MHFLLNEGSLNVTTFRYCCLGFFLAWNPLFIFRYRCCDGHFPCFGKYIFPQLQTCFADCTEGSCSSNIPSNFQQLFSFSFFFFYISNNIISFSLDKYSLLIFNVVFHYQLNALKISKMVQYNHRSFMISPSSHLSYFLELFIQVKPFINSFQSYLFCYKCWLSYFLAIE